jgi:hypothetical protein
VCTRLAAASDQVDQLLAHGRWFSPGTPDSSTIQTGRHDIVEILLKVALYSTNQNRSKSSQYYVAFFIYLFENLGDRQDFQDHMHGVMVSILLKLISIVQ